MEKERGVSRDEFDAFAKEVTDAICVLKTQLEKGVGVALYRCDEEGCRYATDDLGSFIEHSVDERLKRYPAPMEEEGFASAEQPKRRHRSAEEFMDCPECAPKFERMLAGMGWEKPQPEPKRHSGLNI